MGIYDLNTTKFKPTLAPLGEESDALPVRPITTVHNRYYAMRDGDALTKLIAKIETYRENSSWINKSDVIHFFNHLPVDIKENLKFIIWKKDLGSAEGLEPNAAEKKIEENPGSDTLLQALKKINTSSSSRRNFFQSDSDRLPRLISNLNARVPDKKRLGLFVQVSHYATGELDSATKRAMTTALFALSTAKRDALLKEIWIADGATSTDSNFGGELFARNPLDWRVKRAFQLVHLRDIGALD